MQWIYAAGNPKSPLSRTDAGPGSAAAFAGWDVRAQGLNAHAGRRCPGFNSRKADCCTPIVSLLAVACDMAGEKHPDKRRKQRRK